MSFLDVVCWREMAENVSESLSKGSRIVVTGRLEQRSWETAEGEKRSKIEVVADEIGPSLRWATAEVKRNDRRGPGEGGGYNGGGSSYAGSNYGGGRPAAAPASAPVGAGYGANPGYGGGAAGNYDEEPF